jgi:hypothetical protein
MNVALLAAGVYKREETVAKQPVVVLICCG